MSRKPSLSGEAAAFLLQWSLLADSDKGAVAAIILKERLAPAEELTEAQEFWSAIVRNARMLRGENIPPYSKLDQRERASVDLISQELQVSVVRDRAERTAFCNILSETIIGRLRYRRSDSEHFALYHRQVIQRAVAEVDRAFPGYRASGLLHFIAKRGNNVWAESDPQG